MPISKIDPNIKRLTQVFPPIRFAAGDGIDETGHHYIFLTNLDKREINFFNELIGAFDKKDEIAVSETAYQFLFDEADIKPNHFAVFIRYESSVTAYWKHLNYTIVNYKKRDNSFLLEMC